ncbi:50S ribosomal protein [Actinidia chinensis var. chinensis]|uniref:Large ribosomal subunit protein bL21m n=1 Tax=Actinidia chinensis var. chinensis TaxID=1590841 RepID=A0A2R6PXW5_ACTCC|nr:50S ribosomal protein [Actinidia chinensis var. chinensis]
MASRRLHNLTRHYTTILSSPNPSLQSLKTLNPTLQQTLTPEPNLLSPQTPTTPKSHSIFTDLRPICHPQFTPTRHFSSQRSDNEEDDDEEEGCDDDDDDEEEEEDSDDEGVSGPSGGGKREYTAEEREEEAAAIGYKVLGPLERSERVFKPYEPVFAIVQIGSHQFKVSNGDCIFTERLKFCEVNDKLILNKVLMLGSQSQTIIGRPILLDTAVHAVVEEHALDAKVIIFKKKRRKNYRRTKGHRQELTQLRITDIQGIEKPEPAPSAKPEKAAAKKPEKAGKTETASAKKPEKVAVPA